MNNRINRLTMIRNIYRSLLNSGRTYAAFDKKSVIPLIKKLQDRKVILDPMAGYGSLMSFCSEMGISTYNIEYNPPSYLWIILTNPIYSDRIIKIIEELQNSHLPEIGIRTVVSEDWFPEQSYKIIEKLYDIIYDVTARYFETNDIEKISLALLIPFSGRFSSCVPGNIVTHVKPGGICIYENWEEDYLKYLSVLRDKIVKIKENFVSSNHSVLFADARNVSLEMEFSAMITSPPYPNSRDYYRMFAPENECIQYLRTKNIINDYQIIEPLIGNVSVSLSNSKGIDNSKNLISKSAKQFIKQIADFEGNKRAKYDNKIYYIPYFSNYFFGIEEIIKNISKMTSKNFEGYFIVVNNTARNFIIPVAKSCRVAE